MILLEIGGDRVLSSISENLKRYRKQNKLTQLEMAQHLFVTPQAVSKWERGESLPDISLIPKIAKLFNRSISDLWGEEIETFDSSKLSFQAILKELDYLESAEEIMKHFDFILLLNEQEKELIVFKMLSLPGSDFIIEDFYYYLSSQLKEKVLTILLEKERFQGLEALIPMMSTKMRTRVLTSCLNNQNVEFLEELFPFLTFSQKESIIQKVTENKMSVNVLENYVTFFTEKQRHVLKKYEED